MATAVMINRTMTKSTVDMLLAVVLVFESRLGSRNERTWPRPTRGTRWPNGLGWIERLSLLLLFFLGFLEFRIVKGYGCQESDYEFARMIVLNVLLVGHDSNVGIWLVFENIACLFELCMIT